MAIFSGSSIVDWSTVSITAAELDARLETFATQIEAAAIEIDLDLFTFDTQTGTLLVLNLNSGGQVTFTGSGLTGSSPSVSTLTLVKDGVTYFAKGSVDGEGIDTITELTVTAGTDIFSFKGSVSYNNNTDTITGSLTSATVTISGYVIEFKGALTLSGNDVDVNFGGTMTAVSVSGAGGTFQITGLSVPASQIDTIGTVQDILNLALAGNDFLTGGALADSIVGGAGNDTLNGLGGADTLVGGAGNDTYINSDGLDTFTENLNEGTDSVSSSISTTLGANLDNVVLTLATNAGATGNALGNVLTGNPGNNSLAGLAGNDTLIGGAGNDTLDGGSGNDSMNGGPGNDLYRVDAPGDVIADVQGVDTVEAGINYALAAFLENLLLTGFANSGTGNALANTISANPSESGTLTGLAGNDTYILYATSDTVVEALNGGIDTVTATLGEIESYTLAANVENLVMSGSEGFTGVGNGLANVITGSGASDTIQGGLGNDSINSGAGHDLVSGDAGNDTLVGGAGNDTLNGGLGNDSMTGGNDNDLYFVGATGDVVVETSLAGAGSADTVESSLANYTLALNVEHLILAKEAGNLNGTGNATNNSLTGSDGNNVLVGGLGIDTYVGSEGDDTYVLDALDLLSGADSGSDTVIVTFAPVGALTAGTGAFAGIENIVLTAPGVARNLFGDANDNRLVGVISGFGLNESLFGYEGNDTLEGGTGIDTFDGGSGNDTYIFDDQDELLSVGTLIDVSGIDTVVLASTSPDSVQFPLLLLPDFIEHLVLQGAVANKITGNLLANSITGNVAANSIRGEAGDDTLNGNGGNDTLDGGSGNDAMDGGAGADLYKADSSSDSASESLAGPAGGIDLVQATASFTLGANVENLTFTGGEGFSGTGNAVANVITGNNGNNVLEGLGGNDTLVGSAGNDVLNGGLGNDSMTGGNDNDYYHVNATADTVVETSLAGAGNADTVESSLANYTLAANVEHLILAFEAGNLNGTGNAGNNSLTGNDGNNSLNGLAGNDTYVGSDGNDTYVLGAGDSLSGADAGSDTVIVTFAQVIGTLTAGSGAFAGIENITISMQGAFNLVGDANDNRLVSTAAFSTNEFLAGNDGNDTLNGGGGFDNFDGGAGNDTYIFDDQDEMGTTTDISGIDTMVLTSASASPPIVLPGFIENLVLQSLASEGPRNLTGNALANSITGNDAVNLILGLEENDTLNGNAGNDTLDGGLGDDAMDGGAGADLYKADSSTDSASESLAGALGGIDLVQATASFTLGDNVENLLLLGAGVYGHGNTGNNSITGTGEANELNGLAGNDTLIGLGGNDELIGGLGNDSMAGGDGDDFYHVTHATLDVVSETNANSITGGNDTVSSSVSYALGANVENLMLGAGNINGTGNGLANRIAGGTGNNSLNGGLLADTYVGSAGNDTYAVSEAGDTIDVSGDDADTDTVVVSLTGNAGYLDLSDDVALENVTYTGTAAVIIRGNDGHNVLTGGSGNDSILGGLGLGYGNDSLVGGTGKDTLEGGQGSDTLDGGAGIDSMVGGEGDDTYFFDGTDIMDEQGASLGDTVVISAGSFTAIGNFENVTLLGTATNGTGSAVANVLTGNGGANSLDGMGGADTMRGLGGNDTYVRDDAGDVVDETIAGSGGVDLVRTSLDYVLDVGIENATLLAGAGNELTGNGLNNILTGLGNNDTLIGGLGNDTLAGGDGNDVLNGGLGNDSMTGGNGSDYYHVNAAGDFVGETNSVLASGGTDTVEASINYLLLGNFENLVLAAGAGAINGTGNGGNNLITGNEFNNSLSGSAGNDTLDGGLGNDTLAGGAGNDTYFYDAADTITEGPGAANGFDTVTSGTVSIAALALNVENATLTGALNLNVVGNTGNNVITGNAGDNSLTGGAGNDTLSGGAGNDTVLYTGAQAQYTVSLGGGGYIVQRTGEGTDLVGFDVEKISFEGQPAVVLADIFTIPALAPTLVPELDSGFYWNNVNGEAVTLTYSFFTGETVSSSFAAGDRVDFAVMRAAHMDAVRAVLDHYSEIADITFNEVADGETVALRFGTNLQADQGLGGYAYYPDFLQSEVWINRNSFYFADDALAGFAKGTASYSTMLHEVGHAMGLKHPFNDPPNLTPELATNLYSVMAYDPPPRTGILEVTDANLDEFAEFSGYVAFAETWTLMTYDVSTLQVLYGINNDTRSESNTYMFVPTDFFYQTLWDGGGIDTIDVSNMGLRPSFINLNGGTFSSVGYGNLGILNGGAFGLLPEWVVPSPIFDDRYDGTDNLTIAEATVIENATGGSGGDTFIGNAAPNVFIGNGGDDYLDGGVGTDFLTGGDGSDYYVVDTAADVVTELATGGSGTDDVVEIDYDLSPGTLTVGTAINGVTYSNVEGLAYSGAGNMTLVGSSVANFLGGNAANNSLSGLAGDDTLDGGAGADTMVGADGNDTYWVDNEGDVVTDSAGTSDTVVTTLSGLKLGFGQFLYSNIENLDLYDTAVSGTGSLDNNLLFGNPVGNLLDGAAGNDEIFGFDGSDTLIGGSGSDTLYGDVGNDSLTGGADADRFVFDTDPGAGNVDTITDFAPATDDIYLDRSIFVTFYSNQTFMHADWFLAAAAMPAPTTGLQRTLYDSSNGNLYYDGDGNGGVFTPVLYATLTNTASLTAADFFVTGVL